MAAYYVSSVWRNSLGRITHLGIHLNNSGGDLSAMQKTSEANIINFINSRTHTFQTVKWNYVSLKWNVMAPITIVNLSGTYYLRSVADKTTTDNLDSLLPGSALYFSKVLYS